MARAQEFSHSFLPTNKQDYVIDILGFRRVSGGFIFKEVAFLSLASSALPSVYLFKPPYSWSNLSKSEQCIFIGSEGKIHGMDWRFGDIPYHRIQRIFEIALAGARNIYVRYMEEKL